MPAELKTRGARLWLSQLLDAKVIFSGQSGIPFGSCAPLMRKGLGSTPEAGRSIQASTPEG